MNRRDTVKAVGASLLGGTALTASASADGRENRSQQNGKPNVVSVELERADERKTDAYTVDYGDDGRVEITGYAIAPNPCHELEVVDITPTGHGDVVDLELVPDGSELCLSAMIELRYAVELEYPDGDAVPDVFVKVPGGARA